MAEYVYEIPTLEDMHEIADNLREEDRREVTGVWGRGHIREAVEYCYTSSTCSYICKRDGVPLAAFGVKRVSPFQNIGIIWMLATKETAKHKIYVGKWTKKGIQAFLKDWDVLYNFVDQGNNETIKWLKWMGAKILPVRPYGVYGYPYHKFVFGEGE